MATQEDLQAAEERIAQKRQALADVAVKRADVEADLVTDRRAAELAAEETRLDRQLDAQRQAAEILLQAQAEEEDLGGKTPEEAAYEVALEPNTPEALTPTEPTTTPPDNTAAEQTLSDSDDDDTDTTPSAPAQPSVDSFFGLPTTGGTTDQNQGE